MPAISVADTNNLYGALEFSGYALQKGIQPIIASQISLKLGIDLPNDTSHSFKADIVLLAQSQLGYENLIKLSTISHFKEDTLDVPYITLEDLKQFQQGLICLSGGHLGPLGYLALNLNQDMSFVFSAMSNLTQTFKEIFADRFYIEIQRHHLEDEKNTEPLFLKLAADHSIPIVATQNVFFKTQNDYYAHDALLCIADSTYIDEQKRRHETKEHYFKNVSEMERLFLDLPEALDNTVQIAKRCHFVLRGRAPVLPKFIQSGEISEYDELKNQSYSGLEKRLQEEILSKGRDEATAKIYFDRLDYELGVINHMGFPGYFLIVADFIKWAKSKDIPVGPGRGSGAGSLVAWSLTITDIDPIRFSLIFERFLNPERVSMPDFDVDFCQDRRDEVIQYVRSRYGQECVAHIVTFGKFQARMILRDVGRVMQLPYSQVDRLCKMIPNNPAQPVTLSQALDENASLREMIQQDHQLIKLFDMGKKLEGLYRHASTHAAGVVISDQPLNNVIPLFKDESSDLSVTQFSMKYVEAMGLVKFDFLGLKTLTVIQECCILIQQNHNTLVEIHKIPLNDAKTFKLLCDLNVVGVFQLESAGMKDVLKKLQPDLFEDLIALVALYRPGPMDDIPRYLACKHGHEPVVYAHPKLEPILNTTYGVMVYQEQVMQIAQVLAGYSLGAADLLRRAMGKKIKKEMDDQRDLFVKGATERGVEEKTASLIFDQMAKFAGYGFNKSHSAPYALIAYQTAYLKANYPIEFYCASMTLDKQNTDKLNIFKNDMEQYGHNLLKPDINASHVNFTCEQSKDGEWSVRYGLSALKNVGIAPVEQMLVERNHNGSFKNITDFALRLDSKTINKRQLESLIASGAFDELMLIEHKIINRKAFYENVEVFIQQSQMIYKSQKSKQKTLFQTKENHTINLPLAIGKDWGVQDSLQKELDSIGFYLSLHPMDVYLNHLSSLDIAPIGQVYDYICTDGEYKPYVSFAGTIAAVQEKKSKKGDAFAFIQIADKTGVIDLVFFSDLYLKSKELLKQGTCIFVQARVKSEDDNVKFMVISCEHLESKIKVNDVHIHLKPEIILFDRLKNILSDVPKGQSSLTVTTKIENVGKVKFVFKNKFKFNNQIEYEIQSLISEDI